MTNLTITTETDSDWIGDIPDNWSLEKLKYIFSEKKSTSNSDLQCGSISFGKVIFKNDDKVPDSTKQSYQEVLEGEFLINPLNLNFDLKSLRIGLSKISVVVSQGYIVLKINDGYLPSYYEYLLRKFDVEHMKSLGQGVRQTISFTHIKDEKLVVPPPGEQQLISRYLDKKTEQIDSLVEKIQKKIELLKEQRTSLINQCVTKGLDPNVEMKDSGVEWIGEIPKHWEVTKLKHIANIIDGDRGSNYPNENETVDHGILFLSSNNIKDQKLNLTNQRFITVKKFESLGRGKLEKNDLIITVRGSIGNCCIFNHPDHETGFINAQMMILRPNKNIVDPLFLHLISHCSPWKFQLDILAYGTAQQQLSNTILANLSFPFPKITEQTEILDYVLKKNLYLDNVVKKNEIKVSLLKEYRQSLISSVVTGKVRVTEDMI